MRAWGEAPAQPPTPRSTYAWGPYHNAVGNPYDCDVSQDNSPNVAGRRGRGHAVCAHSL